MVGKRIKHNEFYATIFMIFLLAQVALSQVSPKIPADKSQLKSWFDGIIKPVKERGNTLEPELVKAESEPRVIRVMQAGGGDFKKIAPAVDSVPAGNTKRVIISIGPGSYREKITIERDKPFITFLGDAKNMPEIGFNHTANDMGTLNSGTLIVRADHFVAANLNIVNTSPRPDGSRKGAQAVALTVAADKAAFYNCKFIGFQDTLCDDVGNHFFKDCHIRGSVDFIFGNGKSLYLNSEIYVDGGEKGEMTFITAHSRESSSEDTGYVFVHGSITGTAKNAILGRAWKTHPRVVFAYTEMGNVVSPAGWSLSRQPEKAKTVYYGEYKCTGEGATLGKREPYAKQLTDEEAKPFLVLDYIEATKWLLPPPNV